MAQKLDPEIEAMRQEVYDNYNAEQRRLDAADILAEKIAMRTDYYAKKRFNDLLGISSKPLIKNPVMACIVGFALIFAIPLLVFLCMH